MGMSGAATIGRGYCNECSLDNAHQDISKLKVRLRTLKTCILRLEGLAKGDDKTKGDERRESDKSDDPWARGDPNNTMSVQNADSAGGLSAADLLQMSGHLC